MKNINKEQETMLKVFKKTLKDIEKKFLADKEKSKDLLDISPYQNEIYFSLHAFFLDLAKLYNEPLALEIERLGYEAQTKIKKMQISHVSKDELTNQIIDEFLHSSGVLSKHYGKNFVEISFIQDRDEFLNPLSVNCGAMYHPRFFCLQDDFLTQSEFKEIESKRKGGKAFTTDDIKDNETCASIESFLSKNDYVFLPVYITEHSSVSLVAINESGGDDRNLLGYIYESKQDIKAKRGIKQISPEILEKEKEFLKEACAELESYFNGDIFELRISKGKDGTGFVLYGIQQLEQALKDELVF